MKKRDTTKQHLLPPIEFGRRNLVIFLIGVVVLVVGYILLSVGPWDNPLSRSVAPLILLFGYLVIFPVAIFTRGKVKRTGSRGKPG